MRKNFIILTFILFSWPGYGQENIPELNREIIKYIDTVIGSTVGRGECWDLADQALTTSQAKFDKTSKKSLYDFGEEYDPEKEKILPGDIIQFKNVMVRYQKDNMIMTENFGHHTAIVYKVAENGVITLAHQNTNFSGKKVGLSDLNLDNVKKGRMYFYRPVSD